MELLCGFVGTVALAVAIGAPRAVRREQIQERDGPRTGGDNHAVARSLVRLPSDVRSPFDVYVNGVHQTLGDDYRVRDGALVFERELRKDRVSGWRWFLGAWGIGTYRQDDSVDVRYQRADGSAAVAEGLDIELR